MQFEFTDDQLELRDTARQLLAKECPPSVVRAAYEEKGGGDVSRDLWRTMVGLDWPALGLPEAVGGMGLGFIEVGILVEELGRATAPSPYLATITQYAAAIQEAGSTFSLSDVAHGQRTGTLAIAEAGVWRPEAIRTAAAPAPGGGWSLQGRKSHVFDGASAEELVVVARRPGTTDDLGLGLFVVSAESVTAEALPFPMDETIPTATVDIDTTVEGDRVLVEPGDPRARSVIDRTLQRATTAIALSTVATCRALFEVTLQYTKDREQFGRPIGSFQALKHRLADMYLAVERASALAYFAALTIAEDDDRRAVATSMAKAAAGECQRLVVKDGLQMHGGVGYTWEHDLHFLLKRAKAGDLLFGTTATHRAHLARLLGLEAVA
jgi:alkylation response protein AidB-like acyl-CoA dehydrogenase